MEATGLWELVDSLIVGVSGSRLVVFLKVLQLHIKTAGQHHTKKLNRERENEIGRKILWEVLSFESYLNSWNSQANCAKDNFLIANLLREIFETSLDRIIVIHFLLWARVSTTDLRIDVRRMIAGAASWRREGFTAAWRGLQDFAVPTGNLTGVVDFFIPFRLGPILIAVGSTTTKLKFCCYPIKKPKMNTRKTHLSVELISCLSYL